MNSCTINWRGPKIQVVGIGATDYLQLASAAVDAITQARVIIGAPHHIDRLKQIAFADGVEVKVFPRPLSKLAPMLEQLMGQNIVILASGDPLYYGIGAWLNKQVGAENCRYFTNVSSIQAAFALLGKPWQDAQIISLHGRPLQSLRSQVVTNALYAILTDEENTPFEIAQEMVRLGFGESAMWVLESLGQPEQRQQYFTCHALSHQKTRQANKSETSDKFAILNVCIVETKGKAHFLSTFPGIPDEQFASHVEKDNGDESKNIKQTDSGMFTKREVRLVILSLIQPGPGIVGWDVGAGFGSVAVEWARWCADAEIYAIEANADRLATLNYHRHKFGVMKNLHVSQGLAPNALMTLPDPDVVYIGGSQGGIANLLDYCWKRLTKGGRIVISVVTESSRAQLINHVQDQYAEVNSVEWTEISISRGDNLAGHLVLRPRLPVLLLCMVK